VTLKIYIDGVVKASTTTMSNGATSFATTGNNNFLGKRNYDPDPVYFDGQLKDIYFFDVVVGDCATGFTSSNSGLTCTACAAGKYKLAAGNGACVLYNINFQIDSGVSVMDVPLSLPPSAKPGATNEEWYYFQDDSYVDVASQYFQWGTNDFTIMMWVKADSATAFSETDYSALFIKSANANAPYEGVSAFIFYSRKIEFRLSGIAGEILNVDSAVTSWAIANHLAFVRRGNALELHVNGVLKGSISVSQHLNINNAAPFRIGGNHVVPQFQSLIGVGIWNFDAKTRAMSSAEILQAMSAHRAPGAAT